MKQYYGNYLGLCINNDDPERRGRVQIFIPHIMPSLVENWNEAGDDIKILCVGDNLPDSLPSPVVEKLIKMLPWAEVASPILGTSSPGNLINQAVGAVKNFFDQSPVSTPGDPNATAPVRATNLPNNTGTITTNPDGSVSIPGVNVVNDIIPGRNYGVDATKNAKPFTNIVIHDPGGPITTQNLVNYVQTYDSSRGGTFGYHLIIDRDGTVRQAAPWNARTNHVGPEVRERVPGLSNTNALGIVLMGNSTDATPAQKQALQNVIGASGIRNIYGHGEVTANREPDEGILARDMRAIFGESGSAGIQTTSTSGQAATFNPFQSLNPNQIDAGGTLAGSFVQPTVEASSGATVRTASVKEFAANNDGNRNVDVGLSSTYQSRTATGITNDSEILGYTIPLDASLKSIARDSTGNQVAKLYQPALVTFKDGSGKEYRVLAVGNDTGGRQVGGNAQIRDWGEFGTNTFRTLQKQGLDVSLAKNSLGLPAGTTATYQFLDGEVKSVEQYRALQSQLVASGALDPAQVSTPIDTGAAAVASQSGIPNASSMVNNTDKNGPTAILNINNMAKGVFTYPAAGATLWVFFREGNPIFPVYFAANYGEREWQSAFRQGSDAPGISPQTKKGNPITSVGTVANFGTGGWKVEDTTDPTNPSNNQKSFMLFGHDGSNMFFNDGYHQIFSKFDRRDQVDGDRFNSTFGTKEELVQSDSNSMVMGDQYIKVGNISPDTINAARNLQNMVNQIMAPLAKSNLASPPQSLTQALNNSKFVNNKFAKDAIKSSQERFKVPAGPFRVPAQVYKEEVNRIFNPAATPTPEQTLERINTADINAVPITPPTPPAQ